MGPNKIKDLPVICLLGPTASGKTELAIKLSKQLPIDIINVDSAQVYREMDIGTAKPSHELLIEFPHRLIDIRDPEDTYSVSNFVKDANDEIAQIHDKQRIPLMVGGTMLYFHALIEGLSKLPNGDKVIRDTIDNEANIIGWPKMHEKLLFIDSVAAKKINPNDGHRIQRALEIYELTGKNITHLQSQKQKTNNYNFINFAIRYHSRDELHQRINARFLSMIDNGFLEEVSDLKNRKNLTAKHASMKAVGYKQIWSYLDDDFNLDEAILKAQAATRQLAKRQITWLRNTIDALEVDSDHQNLISAIRASYERGQEIV